MSLIKVALIQINKDPEKNKHIGEFVGTTAGIGVADAIARAAFAPKGHRLQKGIEGLKEGLVFGGALGVAEPLIRKQF